MEFSEPFLFRLHEPGDMGWVVHRHGVLYAKEYGWDESYDAEPPRRAARSSVAPSLVEDREAGDTVAKFRLLLIESEARGCELVEEVEHHSFGKTLSDRTGN